MKRLSDAAHARGDVIPHAAVMFESHYYYDVMSGRQIEVQLEWRGSLLQNDPGREE